ncbi:MAG: hypothetical protein V3R67_06995 [Thermodesulfobacteriota bacterium]
MWQFFAGAVVVIFAQYLFDRRARSMFLLDKYENTIIRSDKIFLILKSAFDYINFVQKGPDPYNQYEKIRNTLYDEKLIREVSLLKLIYLYNNAFQKQSEDIDIFTLNLMVCLRNCMLKIQNNNKIDIKKLQQKHNSLLKRYSALKNITMKEIDKESKSNTITHIWDLLLKPFKFLTPK